MACSGKRRTRVSRGGEGGLPILAGDGAACGVVEGVEVGGLVLGPFGKGRGRGIAGLGDRGLGPVEARGDALGAGHGEFLEGLVELGDGGDVACEGLVDGGAIAEVAKDGAEGVGALLAEDEINDEGGLEVGELEVEGGLGGEEGTGELGDGNEVVAHDHAAVAGVEMLAP